MAIKQPHPRHPLARCGILHPFPQQVGDVVTGAVGLALVDVGRGVVEVLGVGRGPLAGGRILEGGNIVCGAVDAVFAGANDVVLGSEFTVGASACAVGDRGPANR